MSRTSDPVSVGDILLDALADRVADRLAGRLAPPEVPAEREALTLDETATALALSLRTVERLIAGGHMHAKRVGQRRIVAVDEVRRFARDLSAVDTNGVDQ